MMDGKILKRLKKLRKKVYALSDIIDEHYKKFPRRKQLLDKFIYAESRQEMYDADKEYTKLCQNIGIGEKAKKMQAELEKKYGDLLSADYYRPMYLRIIIEALESGRAHTVGQAVEIAVKEVSENSVEKLIENIAAQKNLK